MTGPLLFDGLPKDLIVTFQGLAIDKNKIDNRKLGLYFFHMARFTLFFDRNEQKNDIPYTSKLIELITSDYNPLSEYIT